MRTEAKFSANEDEVITHKLSPALLITRTRRLIAWLIQSMLNMGFLILAHAVVCNFTPLPVPQSCKINCTAVTALVIHFSSFCKLHFVFALQSCLQTLQALNSLLFCLQLTRAFENGHSGCAPVIQHLQPHVIFRLLPRFSKCFLFISPASTAPAWSGQSQISLQRIFHLSEILVQYASLDPVSTFQ